MRRLALAALLALAASCSVKTEGAACVVGQDNCPAGQACGYDGKCSEEAVACGSICSASACNGTATVRQCVPSPGGICASFQDVACSTHQDCTETQGAACTCKANTCQSSAGRSSCDGTGNLVECAQESTPATGCWYVTSSAACGAGSTCLGPASGRAACVSLAFTAPPSGWEVGSAGVTVTVKLTASLSGYVPPDAVALFAGAQQVATLARQGTTGLETVYSGTYVPAASTEASVSLTARLADGAGTAESPALSVDVDSAPPRIVGTPTASCTPSPCQRDGTLDVSVAVDEAHPGAVTVTLDLDGDTVPAILAGAAGAYTGHLSLASWAFPRHSAAALVATIHASDARGNAADPQPVSVTGGITRARPPYLSGGTDPVTSPAILSDGTAVVGIGSASAPGPGATDQLRAVAPGGSEAWRQTLAVSGGSGYPVNVAPAAGASALFAASSDGRLYLLGQNGLFPAGTTHVPTPTSLSQYVGALVTPWVRTSAPDDHAFTAGAAGRLLQFWSNADLSNSPTGEAAASGTWVEAKTVLATNGAGVTLRRFLDEAGAATADGTLALTDGAGTPTACDRVSVPLAADSATTALVACDNRQLHRIDVSAATLAGGYLLELPGAPSGSPVVLPGGDLLVPLSTGAIARVIAPATAPELATFATLAAGEVPRGLAVAAPAGALAPATVYATTGNGKLYAFIVGPDPRTAAAELWPATAIATGALDFPTIAPVPSGAPAGSLPTLLVGSADGNLHRVVVDAPLDPDSPWPKAHHDVRNTGNAATPVNGP